MLSSRSSSNPSNHQMLIGVNYRFNSTVHCWERFCICADLTHGSLTRELADGELLIVQRERQREKRLAVLSRTLLALQAQHPRRGHLGSLETPAAGWPSSRLIFAQMHRHGLACTNKTGDTTRAFGLHRENERL